MGRAGRPGSRLRLGELHDGGSIHERMPLDGKPLAQPALVEDLLRAGLDANPDGVALASLERPLSWCELARERIGYRAPEEVVFLDDLPLNPTGKVDRIALKRLAEQHLHPHGLQGT